jgi:CRISPR type III-A-associated protein Csm2
MGRERTERENEKELFLKEVRPIIRDIIEGFFREGDSKALMKILVGTTDERGEVKESLLERFVSRLKGGLSFTRVRKYYEQFLSIYEEAFREHPERKREDGPLPAEIQVRLYLLKSHVVYDEAREGKKEFAAFKEFISNLILRVNTFKSLERAKNLFEAFVGYAKAKLD